MINCIILAGGLGTRLRGVVSDRPKCLAPVHGKPFLYWLIKQLKENGINKFFLSLGFEADKIIDVVHDWKNEFDISWVIEEKQLGTGGALKFCMKHFLLNESLVVNGDTFIEANLGNFLTPLNVLGDELIRMGVVNVRDRSRFGGVEVNEKKKVISFFDKGLNSPGMINAGVYRVSQQALMEETENIFSFENSTLKKMACSHKISAEFLNGSFIDIGVPEDYQLFIDRYQI